MPRKDIDLSDEHCLQLDRLRVERKLTYSELVSSALTAWFAPETPNTQTDQPQPGLESLPQCLWDLDSASQKSAERLAAIETQLDGLHSVVEKALELLLLIAEAQMPTRAAEEDVTPPAEESPAQTPTLMTNIHAGWYRPSTGPVKDDPEKRTLEDPQRTLDEREPSKRSWWRGGKP